MSLKPLWYRRSAKTVIALLEALLTGLLALIIVSLPRWMDGDVTMSQLGRSFEETDHFLELTEQTIREKIAGDQDRELFEQDGDYEPEKLLDIRQYLTGVLDEANANSNTTYRIADLLAFGEEGAARMQSALADELDSGRSEEEAGLALMERSDELETILPLSGVYLKDTAALGASPAVTLVELYRSLSETALDVLGRYRSYAAADAEASSQAPSNIAYYIENTVTRSYYTNLPATSQQAAVEAVEARSGLTFLFDGERRFNIMVSNPEHVMSDRCGAYFMQTAFLGSGEKVVIAADFSFPVGDEIGRAYLRYQQREPVFYFAVVSIALLAVVLVILLAVSLRVNGRDHPGDAVHLRAFETVPSEIAMGICIIGGIVWWMLGHRLLRLWQPSPRRYMAASFVLAAGLYEIVLLGLLSFLRRIYGDNLWQNSVIYYVVVGTRAVYSARKSSQRLLIIYIGFIVLNLLALVIGGVPGVVMALILNLSALLYVMRDMVGNQNIREGLAQISTGRLDYRINTAVLTGESREMGQAVNEMGEGLEKAVDAMLSSERLKAELITNVSHDLKTPLTSIVSYVDLLKRLDLQDERAREYLEVLDNKTQRLKTLTEDLVEVSKITSGNIELHPDRLELRQFIAQAGGEFEDRLAERDIPVIYRLGKIPANVYVDGAKLWRIFENLLGNVYKYGKEGSPLTITLTVTSADEVSEDKAQGNEAPGSGERQALVSFENVSGSRITASAAQLKERFGRNDESRHAEGFGLGLSIADSLAAAMGGSFDVRVTETDFEALLRFPVID